MNCFSEFVGLRGVSSNVVYEYYINDLVGFTTKLLENLQNTDNISIVDFWEKIQREAYKKVLDNFELKFFEYFSVYCNQRPEIHTTFPQILCLNKRLFKLAYINAVALQILMEQRYSRNINYFTTTNENEILELLELHQKQFEDNFKSAMKSVQPPEDDFKTQKNFPNQVSNVKFFHP